MAISGTWLGGGNAQGWYRNALVHGDYLMTSNDQTSGGSSATQFLQIGVTHIPTMTHKAYRTGSGLGSSRPIGLTVQDGDAWALVSQGNAYRVDLPTGNLLEVIALPYTPTVVASFQDRVGLHRYGGRTWMVVQGGTVGVAGWQYGTSSVAISNPGGASAAIQGFNAEGSKIWGYVAGAPSYLIEYDLDTLTSSVAMTFPPGISPSSNDYNGAKVGSSFYWMRAGVGLVTWHPGSPAFIQPNASMISQQNSFVGSDGLIYAVRSGTQVLATNPVGGGQESHAVSGIPAGRGLAAGSTRVVIGGATWLPTAGTG